MKILVLGNHAETLINFRGALLMEFVKAGHTVTACAPEDTADVRGRLKAMGVDYRIVRLDRTGMNPVRDMFTLFGLVSLFRKLHPDSILCYTSKAVIYGSFAGWLTGVRNIYSVIPGLGYVFTGYSFKQRLLRPVVCWLYRAAFSVNKKILFLNQDDIAAFQSFGIIKDINIVAKINGEGVDISQYNIVAAQDCACKPGVSFLLIARLLRDKGILEYVQAASVLSSKYENAKFRLIGPFDTNPTAIKEKQVKEWHASGVIEYLGETKDVRRFIAEASVYVLPSYREGVPRTILEAMAMGRPIVTTDVPGCRETVVDGDNGFLVPAKDPEALALAMEHFILKPALIKQMGFRSRQIAEEKYDVFKVNAVIMHHMGLL